MKTITFILAATMAGCASQPVNRSPSFVSPPSTPFAADPGGVVRNERIATPSVRKAYYVGQIIDPAYPELMYRPGVVFREEIPERWNRNGAAFTDARTGVLAHAPDAALLPPFAPEMEQMIVEQRKVMQLLADRNADLAPLGAPVVAEVPATAPTEAAVGAEAPAPPPAEAPVVAEAPAPAPTVANPVLPAVIVAAAPTATVDFSQALLPNADGAIELSPEILDQIDRSEPNPFLRRHHAQSAFRDLVVTVTGTSLGPRPTASINGRLLNVGDTWEGFAVAAITRDAVYLRKELFLLQIPLARPAGVTVRLPP